MGNDRGCAPNHGSKKKTPFQLQSLENFYREDKYPKQNVMEEYAKTLDLAYNSVRIWFVERRRKERKGVGVCSSGEKKIVGNVECPGSEANENGALAEENGEDGRNDKQLGSSYKKQMTRLQVLLSKEHILKRVFRKDGPALGVEFDPLPANAFCRDATNLLTCRVRERISPKRKATASRLLDPGAVPAKKHGMGKGLMTVWRATNPNNGDSPVDINRMDERTDWMPLRSKISPEKTICDTSKRQHKLKTIAKQKSPQKKIREKRKLPVGKRKVPCSMGKDHNEAITEECKLLVDELKSQEQSNDLEMLVDDEELELRELQAAPNPFRCSAHLASNGRHGCPLCKDLLARFPPQGVKLKQPLCIRPWDSSPELVKKLFKAFRFLYTHSTAAEVCHFTLDDFAQAFLDKDSLLLGKIHMALLRKLLFDVEREMPAGYTRSFKDRRFLGFLHFVREQEFDVNFWSRALNPLTWAEILRHVFIAAGFGSKSSGARREMFNKERNRMAKYGLRPRTLKGELFNMLSVKGSGGLKVSDMANASQIIALNLPQTTEELEQLICFTLSSDITLFEKIGPTAYRLRVDPHIKGREDSPSDDEDSGSVDDESSDWSMNNSNDESDNPELNSSKCKQNIIKYKAKHQKMSQMVTANTEIDESYSGESWVLGLMEGEYSNLSIDEKLDALIALADLAGAGYSSRIEEPERAIRANMLNTIYRGSGAKIKKSSANHHLQTQEEWERSAHGEEVTHLSSGSFAVGSDFSLTVSKEGQHSSQIQNNEAAEQPRTNLHPPRSIYLGSDRRYNSYWLFLGPCNLNDPGHRRVYFESSEDGHWGVIDTTQALRALLSALDCRGSREFSLFTNLETRASVLCQAMDGYWTAEIMSTQRKGSDVSDIDSSGNNSSPISDIDNLIAPSELANSLLSESGTIPVTFGKDEEKKQRWDQLQAFDKWIWQSFYLSLNAVKKSKASFMESLARCESCHDLYWRDEKHCRICHSTFEVDFDLEERYMVHVATCREREENNEFPKHKVLPSQLQALKAAIHVIEMSMPEAALAGVWKRSGHKVWVKRLRRTSSLAELLQVLADFVGAINEEWLYEVSLVLRSNTSLDEIIISFQTMPQTVSAVALWIVKLDMMIAPHLEQLHSERLVESIPQSRRKHPRTR